MGFRDMCPRPARSWCEGSSIRPLTPWSLPDTRRAARVGAAATAAAAGGAMVAGEPLRRVGAPTPRLLRSPPLAKVQSHSHHLLRQVLFAYLAVPPCLVELVVIAILHHSLLHCVVHNPCHPIPAPQRRKIRARSHTRKQAQTAAAIWQAARWGRESAAVRARGSRWCQKGQRPAR